MMSPERLAIKRAKEKRQGLILAAILFGGPILYCLSVPPVISACMVLARHSTSKHIDRAITRTAEFYSFPFMVVMKTPAKVVFLHYTEWWLDAGRPKAGGGTLHTTGGRGCG